LVTLSGWLLARAAPIPAYTTMSKTGRRLPSNWFAAVLWIPEQYADSPLDLIHSGKDGSELVGSEAEVKKTIASSRCVASDDWRLEAND